MRFLLTFAICLGLTAPMFASKTTVPHVGHPRKQKKVKRIKPVKYKIPKSKVNSSHRSHWI